MIESNRRTDRLTPEQRAQVRAATTAGSSGSYPSARICFAFDLVHTGLDARGRAGGVMGSP